jgi:hypothetical protein
MLQQQMKQNYDIAQLTPEQQVTGGLRTAGYELGQGLGGLMGVEDPQMKARSVLQELAGKYDTNTSGGVAALATELQQRGMQQQAMLLGQRALEMRKTEAEAQAKTAEKLTNEQKNAAAGADASGAERGTPEWSNTYKTELSRLTAGNISGNIKEIGIAKSTGKAVYFDVGTGTQFIVKQDPKDPTKQIRVPFDGSVDRSTSNVSLSATADKSYGSELGGLVAKDDVAMRNAAQAAPDILSSVEQTRALLDSGRVYTGTGANVKLNVLAFGQALGVTGATENEIITQTQQLQQQRSKAVLNQIKSSGLGTGQGFTDKDLKFLENASAGTITLSADTLKEQLRIEEKLAKASINKWNARVRTLPAGVTGSMGLAPVELPTMRSNPANQIPTTGGMTGNPLVDKYLVKPAGQ